MGISRVFVFLCFLIILTNPFHIVEIHNGRIHDNEQIENYNAGDKANFELDQIKPTQIRATPLDLSFYVGGSGNDFVTNVVSLSNGDFIVTGLTNSEDFPVTKDAPIPEFVQSNITDYNTFLMRYSPNGTLIWSTFVHTIVAPYIGDIPMLLNWQREYSLLMVDDFDIIYLVFSGPELKDGTESIYNNIYLIKLHSNGSVVWQNNYGGSDQEYVISAIFDKNSNIIITGQTKSVDLPSKINNYKGSNDLFLLKVDENGYTIWSRYFGGTEIDTDLFATINSQNEIYVVVSEGSDSTSFQTLNSTLDTSNYFNQDAYVARLSSNGDLIWDNFISSPDELEFGHEIIVNSDDSFYVLISAATDTLLGMPEEYIPGYEAYVWYHFTRDGLLQDTIMDSQYDPNEFVQYHGGRQLWDRQIVKQFGDFYLLFGRVVARSLNTSVHSIQQDISQDAVDGALKISDNFGTYNWSTYFGNSQPNQIYDIYLLKNTTIEFSDFVFVGATLGNIPEITGTSNGGYDGFISILSNPIQDTDGDQMADYWEEYYELDPLDSQDKLDDIDNDGLSNLNEYLNNTNPRKTDSDNDLIDDLWEIQYSFDPNNPKDAFLDVDQDDLHNLEERYVGTSPRLNDTDSDMMDDGYEVRYFLNPLDSGDAYQDLDNDGLENIVEARIRTNPNMADTESDGMPDGWEVAFALNPLRDDGHADLDGDGLSNLREFLESTLPNDRDTDNDGMDDYWEVIHDLDPLYPEDRYWDGDNDGISNIWEYRLNTDPTEFSVSVYIIFLMILISIGLSFWQVWRLHKQATSHGFSNYFNYRKSMRLGFSTKSDLEKAKSRGFIHVNIRFQLTSIGVKTVDQLIENIDLLEKEILGFIKNNDQKYHRLQLNQIDSPEKLSNQMEIFQDIEDTISQYSSKIQSFLSFIELVHQLDDSQGVFVLVSLTPQMLDQVEAELKSIDRQLKIHRKVLTKMYDEKFQWFTPWKRMLSLIQITQDNIPTTLEEISQIVDIAEDHAENLLLLLLKENPLIGKYDPDEGIYQKGTMIENYLQKALNSLAKIDD